MRQWVEAAYLTRAFVIRTHEYVFRKGPCDSLVSDPNADSSVDQADRCDSDNDWSVADSNYLRPTTTVQAMPQALRWGTSRSEMPAPLRRPLA
jgi:hypothetical protein